MTRRAARMAVTDVAYYVHVPGKRKRPIAHSTVATSRLLGLLHEDNPDATITEIRAMINYDPDALAVCDAYIAHGEGDAIPNWRY